MVSLIVTLIIIGLVYWLVSAFLPIDSRFKQIIYVLLVIFAIVAVLGAFGVNVPFFSRLNS